MDYRILGPLEVCDGDRKLRLGGDKQRALLALLLLQAGEVVSADRLIDELWGESAPPTALNALQAHVSRLRRALEDHEDGSPGANGADGQPPSDGVLLTRGHGYLLRVERGELDLDRFGALVEQGRDALSADRPEEAARLLREALGLWRGPPLADFTYDGFAQAAISQLEELHLGAVEDRVEADLALGRDRELVSELRDLVGRHPLRERLRSQLMLALHRCGRQAEALEVYQEFRQGLSAELGLEPSDRLQLLERSILMRDTAIELAASTSAGLSADRDGRVVVCPFKGLAFFDVGDAEYFYGREQITADLVSRLASGSFAGLVGSSGGGKSSILRAGLLSALARGVLPGSAGWRLLLLRPGEEPVAELERALRTADIAEALASLEPGERIVLAVDQLEEVFTVCGDAEERAVFLDALVHAALDPDRRAAVVVALRADFYGRFSEHPRFGELLSANHSLVGPMERGDLVRAIELPAGRAELEIERPLVEALVGDVAHEPGGLPLLSTALLEQWRLRDGRVLRYESYRTSGGVRGAVARLAEQAYARLNESEQDAARAILLRLCSGEAANVVRRRVPLGELHVDRDERVAHLLAILTDARLLTASDGTVEVAHEALLREWPRLRGWLEEDREGRRLYAHLAAAAGEWAARDHDPAELYRGARLSAALEWTAHHASQLSEREREFVDASRAASERQLRRLRLLLAGVAVLLAVAVAAGIVAVVQRQNAQAQRRDAQATARAAKSRALAAASQAQLSVDPERSILLAVAAVHEAPTPDAVFALRGALDASPLERRLASVGAQLNPGLWGPGVSYSPDGRRLAEGSQSGVVKIFAVPSGRVLRKVRLGASAPVVAFSPDGSRLAVSTDHSVVILDASTGATLLTAKGMGYDSNFAFSADGSVLYFASNERGVVRWDLRTDRKRLLTTPCSETTFCTIGRVGSEFALTTVALSADGRRLAVGGFPGVALLDTATGRVLATADLHRTVWSVAFSPHGSRLAVASGPDSPAWGIGGTLALLDPRTLAPRKVLRSIDGSTFLAVAFSPDGTKLAYGGVDGSAGVLDLRGGAQPVALPGNIEYVWQVAFSPDGRQLATAAGDGTTLLWRVGGNEQGSIPAGRFDITVNGNGDYPADLRLFADRVVVRLAPLSGTAREQDQVVAYSFQGRRLAAPLAISRAMPYGLDRLSDDARVAVTIPARGLFGDVGAAGAPLQVWNIPARRIAYSTLIDSRTDNEVPPAISPDDSQVALGVNVGSHYRDQMELVSPVTGHVRRLRPTLPVSCRWESSGYTRNGRYLAAGTSCGQVYIWDTTTGRQIGHHTFSLTVNLQAPRFSPDGSHLAVANTGNSGQVSILDVATDKVVTVLTAHTGHVQDIAYSPNGKLLATASIDHTVRIWDAHTGRPLRILYHPDAVDAVAFSPNSDKVATLDYAGTIRLWDACTYCENPTALLALAKRRVTRQLTLAERREFFGN
jgi:WD40 repeat protein/DNA-binding SARP family transcriptional activator